MSEWLPFVMQGLVLSVDEFYCHRRRNLRAMERWGHPLDTLLFAGALGFLLVNEPSRATLWIYGAWSAVSCLFVTKDEWEHSGRTTGFENWLHALLFLLHPVALIWAGWLWWHQTGNWSIILSVATTIATVFAGYQLVYWNLVRRDGIVSGFGKPAELHSQNEHRRHGHNHN